MASALENALVACKRRTHAWPRQIRAGIDSVLKASGAVTSAFIKSGSRPQQSVRAGVVVRGLSATAQHRRHCELPRITEQLRLRSFRPWPHEPYAWSRPQRWVDVGGFGRKLPAERPWVPLSELLLFGSLLLWEPPRVTRPRSAGQAIGASFPQSTAAPLSRN
jgi:hypothetical protein